MKEWMRDVIAIVGFIAVALLVWFTVPITATGASYNTVHLDITGLGLWT